MAATQRLGLPYIAADQAQKHVPHNAALDDIDAILPGVAISATTTAPPPAPAEGNLYIVGPGGAFGAAGPGDLAIWRAGAWKAITPAEGWAFYVLDQGRVLRRSGGAWAPDPLAPALLGVNAAPDAVNRLAVKSDAVLFTHDDVTPGTGDARVNVNKAAAGGTAAHLFQVGFSARAEFGLLGSEDFALKVTPDGAAWFDALRVDRASGRVTFPAGIAGTGSAAGALGGQVVALAAERNALIVGNFFAHGNGGSVLDGPVVPFAARVLAATLLVEIVPAGTIEIEAQVNGAPAPGYTLTVVSDGSGRHTAVGDFSAAPLVLAAGDTINWKITQSPANGNGGIVTTFLQFL